MILDVFRRQYFTEAGRPVEWTSSTYFAFTVRYVKGQEIHLLSCSGRNGVYIEPKTEDASSPHLDFQVVWLPQLSHAEIVHKVQCEPHSLGVARSGKRYGVRVRAIHFQRVFQALKPDGFFLAPGARVSWHCGPWPYGVDRKTLAAVFKKWGWQARPLQPTTSVVGGMMWTVQSVEEPPQVVFTMQHMVKLSFLGPNSRPKAPSPQQRSLDRLRRSNCAPTELEMIRGHCRILVSPNHSRCTTLCQRQYPDR